MASNYETTEQCPALAIEGHSCKFDKLITKDTKSDGVVIRETATEVYILIMTKKILILT